MPVPYSLCSCKGKEYKRVEDLSQYRECCLGGLPNYNTSYSIFLEAKRLRAKISYLKKEEDKATKALVRFLYIYS